MYHISGFSLIARALLHGGTLIFPATTQPVFESIQQHDMTHLSLVPTQLIQLLQDRAPITKLKEMTAILLGGAPLPLNLIQKAIALELPIGEILVKGQVLFKGYVHEKRVVLPLDDDGFFATGDIGYFDDGNNLNLTGRKDLMFISGGENIHPEEIEQVLVDLESVEQAVVVPVGGRPFRKTSCCLCQNKK
jgi:O-succinylbenzoic acid--CoA ligase